MMTRMIPLFSDHSDQPGPSLVIQNESESQRVEIAAPNILACSQSLSNEVNDDFCEILSEEETKESESNGLRPLDCEE